MTPVTLKKSPKQVKHKNPYKVTFDISKLIDCATNLSVNNRFFQILRTFLDRHLTNVENVRLRFSVGKFRSDISGVSHENDVACSRDIIPSEDVGNLFRGSRRLFVGAIYHALCLVWAWYFSYDRCTHAFFPSKKEHIISAAAARGINLGAVSD